MGSLPLGDIDKAVGGDVSSVNWPSDRYGPPPFSVVQYIEQYGDQLDGHGFAAMCLEGDVWEISDVCAGILRGTAVG